MNGESKELKVQIGLVISAALMITAFQAAQFPNLDSTWLSGSEMDAMNQEKVEAIDFTTCRKDPGSPRGELRMIEASSSTPEAILGKTFSFYPIISSISESYADAMTIRWSVVTPVESQVSMTPVYAENFQLNPDTEGTYKVRMAVFRGNQLCDFKETKMEVKNPKQSDRRRLYLAKRRSRMTA